MGKVYRKIVGRASVILLISMLMLIPPVTSETAGASEEDIPELHSLGATSRMFVDSKDADKGLTLVAPWDQNKVFLVDYSGTVVHTWQTNRNTKGTVKLLEDGTLLRGGQASTGGSRESVQLYDWDGTLLWDYLPPIEYMWHHDIEPLPNGNFLINTRVTFSSRQMIDNGRNPAITKGITYVDPILEIRPNGTDGGDIVWKWDPMDHVIQDYDSESLNYGVVKDHPELIDINFPPVSISEWQHANTVSYNAELDQVMITNRNFDEFWVIDHNTTMEEAAGHSGGAHGKGGDILYRWGNPRAYDAGDDSDQVLYGPHDAQWIGPGLPGEGNIIVFNNGMNLYMTRPEGRISTVEELVPPVNATGGYNLTLGSAYGPIDPVWSYTASPPESFFAWSMGGVQRLPDGNTLVCGGSNSHTLEVNPENEVVWDYTSYVLFKARRYYPPALGLVQDLQAIEDVMLRVNISSLISDVDTDHDDLAISEDSRYASISGHELKLLYPDGVTTEVINLTVSDGIFEVGRDVRVNIKPVNDPPVLAPVPDIETTEGVPYTLDLELFISDPDTDIDKMNITEDSSFVTVEGTELRFLYPKGVLTDKFSLMVSDGEFEAVTEILVNVIPANDPPTVDPIPDQEGVEDVAWDIDLEMYIRDIDSPIEDISVASDSQYTSVSGLNLSLQYPEGVTKELVFLTISDGKNETTIAFNVTIEPVNDPPVIEEIPPLTITEDVSTFLDIGPSIYDIDTPKEELTLKVDSPFIDVRGLVLTLLYPDGVIRDEVVIEVWDGDLHTSTSLVVDVDPINDPPIWTEIPEIAAFEDVEGEFDLGPFMFDIDTPLLELEVEGDSSHGWVEGHIFKFTYPHGVLKEQVYFTLTDGEFEVVLRTSVIVTLVNRSPELSGPCVNPPGGSTKTKFNFKVVFKDIDMGSDTPVIEVIIDGFNYTCVRDEPENGTYSEGVVFFLEIKLTDGNHSFHFTADDCDGGTVTTEPLTVLVEEIEISDGGDKDDSRALIMVIIIICTVILVAILLIRRKGVFGSAA